MPDDLTDLRRRLAALLPGRVLAALAGYQDFTAGEPPADAKGFAAWHAAAKAALAHVELLVKLARWAESGIDQALGTADGLDHLLTEARAALDALDDDVEELPV